MPPTVKVGEAKPFHRPLTPAKRKTNARAVAVLNTNDVPRFGMVRANAGANSYQSKNVHFGPICAILLFWSGCKSRAGPCLTCFVRQGLPHARWIWRSPQCHCRANDPGCGCCFAAVYLGHNSQDRGKVAKHGRLQPTEVLTVHSSQCAKGRKRYCISHLQCFEG